MSLKSFERKLEELLAGVFVKSFKSSVQPIEIAKKLAQEMEANKIISIAQIYAPNEYTVLLNQKDYEDISLFAESLSKELQNFLVEQAKEKSYTLLSLPEIKFEVAGDYPLGKFSIESRLVEKEGQQFLVFEKMVVESVSAKKAALVLLEGEEQVFPLNKPRATLGRLKTNDICLSDTNVSRKHAEIVQTDTSFTIRDLDSTNGIFVNGKRVKKQRLKDGDIITLGKTNLRFKENGV
ncbi:MAG: DUF3662 and FHA domain-containing protein [Candidatus Subteraquimicrobiales bacterium]|nr:DUF3662 and FHA domain-containing protein [Candidatus Subteraquimicrobiales bacterium]